MIFILPIFIVLIVILILPFKKSQGFKISMILVMAVFALALYVKFIPIPQDTTFCDEGCQETRKVTILEYIMKLVSKNRPNPVYVPGGWDDFEVPM